MQIYENILKIPNFYIYNKKLIMLEQSTINKLKGIVPDSVLSQIPDTAAKFNITTSLRLAHFLSQCAHESGNFKYVRENLNYSVDGLKKTFGKYFPGNLNESYARNPEKIANRVYGNRMGNGNEASGDGYKYCGRGFIQLTGKENYAAFDKYVIDGIVNAVSYIVGLFGAIFRKFQTGKIESYVMFLVFGVIILSVILLMI